MIRGGRSLVSAPPAFSNDAKKLLVCTGPSVSIFSTSTGLLVTSLEGHSAFVTSVLVVPSTSKALCYCWTASLDGTIKYWDYSIPELVKTINVKYPIYSMVIPNLLGQSIRSDDQQPDVFAYFSVENTKAQKNNNPNASKALHGQILKCNLTKSRLAGGVTLVETQKPELITISASGKFIGILKKRKLYIWNIPDRDSERTGMKRIILHHTKSFAVLAFHPTDRIVAAGDVTGRILIWRAFGERTFSQGDVTINEQMMNNKEERPGVKGDDDADSCSTWHWHSSEVIVLHFSTDGAYLYSGGREGVFVVWQLNTGKKKFLPRIGSPLLYFKDSPDPSLSSLSCADNQIHLLKMPSLEILKSISGIKLPCPLPETYECFFSGLAFDEVAGSVALLTENYCVQFYSLYDDRGLQEVQICERNHLPGDDVTVVLTLVVLSSDGSIMSTVESKLPEEGMGGLACLKFWASEPLKREFRLLTVVYEPHREAGITAVAFHPTRLMAVSSSSGGDFKIWVCSHESQLKDQMPENGGWTCHAVGSYKKKPLTAAAFSTDGSVLAVAAETLITLWDPDKNVLVAVMGETVMPIVTLSFVGNSEYLVSASKGSEPHLSVWNLSKLSGHWSYKLQVEAVACASDSTLFAILALLPASSTCMGSKNASFQERDGLILIFNAKKPVPVATWSVRKAMGGGLGFVRRNMASLEDRTSDTQQSAQWLAYINGDHEYVIFYPCGNEAYELSAMHQESLPALEETGQFGYESIYGELREYDQRRSQDLVTPLAPAERPWETIFSGSSHTLPPLTKLCGSFLESFLEKQPAVVE